MMIERRQFLSGLGAGAASIMLPNMARAVAACEPQADTACRVIDMSIDTTRVAGKIADAGFNTVIRFYTRLSDFDHGPYSNTAITATELKALEEHHLAVGAVFQYYSSRSANFHEPKRKIYDVRDALKYADTITKQPEGSTIYFGADFNLQDSGDYDAIKRYFEYAHSEVSRSHRSIGVYGCGKTCEILAEENWDDMHYWISASVSYTDTAKFFNNGSWHLFQTKTDVPRLFGGIDLDIVNPKFGSFGQWKPGGKLIPETADGLQKILDARRFVLVKGMKFFSDPTHPDATPITLGPSEAHRIDYGRCVRVLCSLGKAVGISLDESDNVRGYCEAADLGPKIPSF